jgi:hypothetical protein
VSPRTEQELLDATIDLATMQRWAVHHDRPARRSGARWATAISGHAGFPDLVLARNGVVLFRELKGYQASGRMGRLSSEQRDWAGQLDPFWKAGAYIESARLRIPFDVWTPDDWDLIVATLTTKQTARTT